MKTFFDTAALLAVGCYAVHLETANNAAVENSEETTLNEYGDEAWAAWDDNVVDVQKGISMNDYGFNTDGSVISGWNESGDQ